MTETRNSTPTPDVIHRLDRSVPPSLVERLVRGLEAQAADEAHDIAACEQLSETVADPISRFLLDMVVQDGRHRYALVEAMLARLREDAEFEAAAPQKRLPPVTPRRTIPDGAEIAAAVRALIRDEHEAARHVRHLARQEPGLHDGLVPLMLETIARDSEKHATILQFVQRRLEERAE